MAVDDHARFRVWDADDGRELDLDNIKLSSAYDAQEAAEEFAERVFDDGDSFDSMDVGVMSIESNVTAVYKVSVDYAPEFHAHLKKASNA